MINLKVWLHGVYIVGMVGVIIRPRVIRFIIKLVLISNLINIKCNVIQYHWDLNSWHDKNIFSDNLSKTRPSIYFDIYSLALSCNVPGPEPESWYGVKKYQCANNIYQKMNEYQIKTWINSCAKAIGWWSGK